MFSMLTAASGAAIAAVISFSGTAAAATTGDGHNPPGNNGTVFIHDVAGDEHPHNVPHVSCQFYVDFFGFDAGQHVSIDFVGQAPTGKGVQLLHVDDVMVSDDDASGAGQDFDSEWPFSADSLGVTALGDPAKQGYHVKLTVETGRPGAHGVKHKVFWILPCGTPSSAPSVAPTAAVGGEAAVAGTNKHHSNRTSVLGEHFTRPESNQQTARTLPMTGTSTWLLVVLGIAALVLGCISALIGHVSSFHRSH